VGLVSRFLVNYFLEINVFRQYTEIVSIVYYGCFSTFIVAINNLDLTFSVFKLCSSEHFKVENIINAIKRGIKDLDRITMNMGEIIVTQRLKILKKIERLL